MNLSRWLTCSNSLRHLRFFTGNFLTIVSMHPNCSPIPGSLRISPPMNFKCYNRNYNSSHLFQVPLSGCLSAWSSSRYCVVFSQYNSRSDINQFTLTTQLPALLVAEMRAFFKHSESEWTFCLQSLSFKLFERKKRPSLTSRLLLLVNWIPHWTVLLLVVVLPESEYRPSLSFCFSLMIQS